MKLCPRCGCTVNSESECRICGETLTFVSDEHSIDRESFVPSRYLLLYFLRRAWFPCAAAVITLVLLLTSETQYIAVDIILLVPFLLSFFAAFFHRTHMRLLQRVYSVSASHGYDIAARYGYPLVSVAITALIHFFG